MVLGQFGQSPFQCGEVAESPGSFEIPGERGQGVAAHGTDPSLDLVGHEDGPGGVSGLDPCAQFVDLTGQVIEDGSEDLAREATVLAEAGEEALAIEDREPRLEWRGAGIAGHASSRC